MDYGESAVPVPNPDFPVLLVDIHQHFGGLDEEFITSGDILGGVEEGKDTYNDKPLPSSIELPPYQSLESYRVFHSRLLTG
jgi:hypothetical protein